MRVVRKVTSFVLLHSIFIRLVAQNNNEAVARYRGVIKFPMVATHIAKQTKV